MKKITLLTAIIASLLSSNAMAKVETGDAKLDGYIGYLQKSWAEANYQSANDDEKEAKLLKLAGEAKAITNNYSTYAEPKIWQAIITSTYAGVKGGMGALSLVEESKELLESSLAINPNALEGSAYTSLGSLYYKVPGWPIGFGSNKKARKNLEQALALNPNGIDPNYFYADFLFEQGEYQQAYTAAQKALNASPRADRPLADKGRKEEITALLSKIEKKLK